MPSFVFNQTAKFYQTAVNDRFGRPQINGIPEIKRCRYNLASETFRDQRGKDVQNIVGLHTYYDNNIREGSCFILSNNLAYSVEAKYHTPDRNGNLVKTYCELKQIPIKTTQ